MPDTGLIGGLTDAGFSADADEAVLEEAGRVSITAQGSVPQPQQTVSVCLVALSACNAAAVNMPCWPIHVAQNDLLMPKTEAHLRETLRGEGR